MATKSLPSWVQPALEFGPLIGFLMAYLMLRNATLDVAGTAYSGFVVVIAVFIPIFVIAISVLWWLTGQVARIQIAAAVMMVVFGGLSVWFNDPRVFKMKPTAIYLLLAAVLGVGLWRGKSWLKLIMEDTVPLKSKGWMILTKRVTVLFLLSAVANEVVWRTQSETFWVVFETVVMPVVIFGFFVSQIGLYIEYATWKKTKKTR